MFMNSLRVRHHPDVSIHVIEEAKVLLVGLVKRTETFSFNNLYHLVFYNSLQTRTFTANTFFGVKDLRVM